MDQSLINRPEKVGHAVMLLYITLGIGVLMNIIEALMNAQMLSSASVAIIFQLGIMWLFIYMIGKGYNWARITFLVLFIISIPFSILIISKSLLTNPISGLLVIVQTVVQTVAVVFLFQAPSSQWFQAMKVNKYQLSNAPVQPIETSNATLSVSITQPSSAPSSSNDKPQTTPYENVTVDSLTQEAFKLLNSQPDQSAELFLKSYHQNSSDDTLTNFAISLWIAVKMSCHKAAMVEICAKSNMRDMNYAEELYVSAIFRLLNEKWIRSNNPNLHDISIMRLSETVSFSLYLLKMLVEERHCEYAAGWYVELLRGAAKYAECRKVMATLLNSELLTQDSRKLIEGCSASIDKPENESQTVCLNATDRFPDILFINVKLLEKIDSIVNAVGNEFGYNKLYGNITETIQVPSNTLVQKLISNDDPIFLAGLREAVTRADSGDYEAVKAMREAMTVRSGKPQVSFYEAGIVITNGADRYIEARPKILDLAKRRALLDDPQHSGNLVSAFVVLSDRDALRSLLHEIYEVGGPSEGYAFQLLFNELRSSARFNASKR
jgi:hypothetical protein